MVAADLPAPSARLPERFQAALLVLPAIAGAWSVYVLRCADGSLYCGISTDLPRRWRQHVGGRAARYTRSRAAVEMRILWPNLPRQAAAACEYRFKQWPKHHKEALWRQLPPVAGVVSSS